MRSLDTVPAEIRTVVRNNVGGHVNHSIFWTFMGPAGGGGPTGELAEAIDSVFGYFESFKTTFNDGGVTRFGSGWVWLVLNRRGPPRGHEHPQPGQPDRRRRTRWCWSTTCGSTPTTSPIATAGPSTWPPGGTSSTGTTSPSGSLRRR